MNVMALVVGCLWVVSSRLVTRLEELDISHGLGKIKAWAVIGPHLSCRKF